ncbi:MAG: Rieske 2Fe-2S domain-containing protein [Candidatus Baltobacteraceae bacterium]
MQFVRVARTVEIQPGEAKAFAVGRWEIGVFNVAGAYYAVDNVCPHQGGPLAEGWIDGPVVTCPWHAWCFDVRTGVMTLSDLCRLERFAVQIEGDEIWVGSEPLGT